MSIQQYKFEVMIKNILTVVVVLVNTLTFSQETTIPFQAGEWLKFRMSYSGFLKAGEMELSLKEETLNGKTVLHATGKGRTSDVVGWFFKVRDNYQSYFDKETVKPYLFKRNIDEGGYKKNKVITFDYTKKHAKVKDLLHKKDTLVTIGNIQDMISTFYFLRKHDVSKMKKGDEIDVNMFFDEKTFPFKLRLLGFENLKTKFGKVKTMIFQPIVQSGRVFKAKESVKVWITADDNKIPIKMKAELSVGSLRAELDAYKGLANPFEIVFD